MTTSVSGSRKKVVVLTTLTMFLVFPLARIGWSQQRIVELEQIRLAISEGNARDLISLSSGTLELALLGASRQYSSSQAALVLKQFFDENRPNSFEITDSTRSARGLFIEGKIRTEDKNRPFRAYLRLNRTGEGWVLRELLIERLDS